MKLDEHPRSREFAEWFKHQAPTAAPLAGEFYRVAGPRHTTVEEILSGIGAWKSGGRWNPTEVMNVIYLSEQPETAMHEANEHFRYYNIPIWRGMPKVTVAVRASLDRILDLTSEQPANALPETMELLLAEDWRAIMARGAEATTQANGRAAFQAGVQGLRVPSKPDPIGVNLVLFPALFTNAAQLQVLSPDELDKLGRKS